jgi:hypothetical protein
MPNTVTKSVSLQPELVERVEKAMEEMHIKNFSIVASMALSEWLKKKGC